MLTSLNIFYANLSSTLVLVSVTFLPTGINMDEISLTTGALNLLIDLVRMAKLVVGLVMLPI